MYVYSTFYECMCVSCHHHILDSPPSTTTTLSLLLVLYVWRPPICLLYSCYNVFKHIYYSFYICVCIGSAAKVNVVLMRAAICAGNQYVNSYERKHLRTLCVHHAVLFYAVHSLMSSAVMRHRLKHCFCIELK